MRVDKKFEKKNRFFSLTPPRPPLIQSNRSSRLVTYRQHIYIYTNVLFYYVDNYLQLLYMEVKVILLPKN